MAKGGETVLGMAKPLQDISNDRSCSLQNSTRLNELPCVHTSETIASKKYRLDFRNIDVKQCVYPTLLPDLCRTLNDDAVVRWIFIELPGMRLVDVVILKGMWNDQTTGMEEKINKLLWSVLEWDQPQILEFLTFLCNLENIPLRAELVRGIINSNFEGSVKQALTRQSTQNRQTFSSSESGVGSTISSATSSSIQVSSQSSIDDDCDATGHKRSKMKNNVDENYNGGLSYIQNNVACIENQNIATQNSLRRKINSGFRGESNSRSYEIASQSLIPQSSSATLQQALRSKSDFVVDEVNEHSALLDPSGCSTVSCPNIKRDEVQIETFAADKNQLCSTENVSSEPHADSHVESLEKTENNCNGTCWQKLRRRITLKRVARCVCVCAAAILSYELIKYVSNKWNANTASETYGIVTNNPNSSLIIHDNDNENERIDPSQNSGYIRKTEIRRDDKFHYNFSRSSH